MSASKVGLARAWLVAACVLGIGSSPAGAWSHKGHRLAGAVADARLSAARKAIADLLGEDGRFPEKTLAGISNWADDFGHDVYSSSAPWHYVNVPIGEARYREEFCTRGRGCVVSKIHQFRRILTDPKSSRESRKEALLFYVHFVEDVHQPLHVGDDGDRGGNDTQVQFANLKRSTNLHRLWDDDLIEHTRRGTRDWLSLLGGLADRPESAGWTRGTPEDWATESLKDAAQAYHHPGTKDRIRAGDRLGESYARFGTPIVERRLAQAGVRLAHELNSIYTPIR